MKKKLWEVDVELRYIFLLCRMLVDVCEGEATFHRKAKERNIMIHITEKVLMSGKMQVSWDCSRRTQGISGNHPIGLPVRNPPFPAGSQTFGADAS